jgi:hypothetical protein
MYESVSRLERYPRARAAGEISESTGLGMRQLVVGDYLLYFRIDERARCVYIGAFRHGARDG